MPGRSRFALPERLPPLTGRVLTTYGIVWKIALAAAIVMTAWGAWIAFQPARYGWLYFGVISDTENRSIAVVNSVEAQASGIVKGDRIVAVDGVPIAGLGSGADAVRAALQRPEGGRIALTLRDARGQVLTHRLTRRAANTLSHRQIQWLQSAHGLIGQVVMILGAIALFGRRREPVPAILALAFALCASGFYSFDIVIWFGIYSLWPMMAAPGMVLLLLGLLVFPDGRLGGRGVSLLGVAIVAWLPLFLAFGDGDVSWIASAILIAAVMLQLIVRYRHLPPGITRQQVRWAFLGIAVYGVLSVVAIGLSVALTASAGPGIGLEVAFRLTGALGTICLIGGLLISLLRYRLYDADAVIGRSAVYGLLTISFLALFAGGEKVIEVLGEHYLGEGLGTLAAGLSAALAAVLVVPLHHRVGHWAEHRFQRALVRLRQGLPVLVGDLRETASPGQIAAAAVRATLTGVQATRAAVLLGDAVAASEGVTAAEVADWRADNEPFEHDAPCAMFPTRVRLGADATGPIGWLLVGRRPDGTPIGKDEREALDEVAEPVARALAIARARGLREAGIDARLSALESGLERLLSGRKPRAVSAT